MIKETKSNKKYDNIEHFTVPEGYFESFTQTMMDKLPEQPFQPMNISRRRSPLLRIAASVAVLFVLALSAYTIINNDKNADTASIDKVEQVLPANQATQTDNAEDYTIDEAIDYAMIDMQTIHELVTE